MRATFCAFVSSAFALAASAMTDWPAVNKMHALKTYAIRIITKLLN